MRIFVNTNAVNKHIIDKKIAPISAREELKYNIRFEHANLKNNSIQDKAQAIRNLKKWETTYAKTSPEKIPSVTKNIMWKRAKQLKDEFSVGMLSTDELHPVRKFTVNGAIQTLVDQNKLNEINSVKRQAAWEKRNSNKIKEYKNIMRHLLPEDPSATNIEKFRPNRGVR